MTTLLTTSCESLGGGSGTSRGGGGNIRLPSLVSLTVAAFEPSDPSVSEGDISMRPFGMGDLSRAFRAYYL